MGTVLICYFILTFVAYGNGFIRQTDLPLVNLGTKDDPRWYPAEKLRVLAYQKFKGLVPSILTSSMLAKACQRPPEAKALVGIEGLETLGWTRNQAGHQTQDFVLVSRSQSCFITEGYYR
jgi:hypothetical protein